MTVRPIVLVFFVVALAGACKKSADSGDAGASAGAAQAEPTPQLPPPFASVRIGMTEAELKVLFPPTEDVSGCSPKLVGGDAPNPTQVPGSEKKPRARCARAVDIAGMTRGELQHEDEYISKTVTAFAARTGRDVSDYRAGVRYTFAQLRGSLRAGTVTEAALLEANRGKSATAYGAVTNIEAALFNGSTDFATAFTARRELCALIADTCDDLDADRVRDYVQGHYTLGQIDADARSRVEYGKCRAPYLQGEKKIQMKLVSRAGGLAGFGLARASRQDHQLNADDPGTFTIYSSRSKLDQPVARFGVMVGNALPQTETYWQGAVALLPGDDAKSDWGSAVVWMHDGKVARVIVNVADDTKLGDLPKALADVYGAPGATQATVTTWSLPAGLTAKLDIGAAVSLVVVSSVSSTAAAAATSAATSVPTPLPTAAPSVTPSSVAGSGGFAPGTLGASADFAACCAALQKATDTAPLAQKNGYSTLVMWCGLPGGGPASGRRSQLLRNAAASSVTLPSECL